MVYGICKTISKYGISKTKEVLCKTISYRTCFFLYQQLYVKQIEQKRTKNLI